MTEEDGNEARALSSGGGDPGGNGIDHQDEANDADGAESVEVLRARAAEAEQAAAEARQQMVDTVVSSAEKMAAVATEALSRPVFVAQFVGVVMVFGALGLTIAQGVYGPYDQNAFLTTTQFVTLVVAGSALILGGPILLAKKTQDQDVEKSKQLEAIGAQPKTELELMNEELKRARLRTGPDAQGVVPPPPPYPAPGSTPTGSTTVSRGGLGVANG